MDNWDADEEWEPDEPRQSSPYVYWVDADGGLDRSEEHEERHPVGRPVMYEAGAGFNAEQRWVSLFRAGVFVTPTEFKPVGTAFPSPEEAEEALFALSALTDAELGVAMALIGDDPSTTVSDAIKAAKAVT